MNKILTVLAYIWVGIICLGVLGLFVALGIYQLISALIVLGILTIMGITIVSGVRVIEHQLNKSTK